ncbi:MAG: hypothetical protein IPJ43_17430 [Saprospiraceae bacterium]|nr:hypothetical protein [Saprospiraceae bacterium]
MGFQADETSSKLIEKLETSTKTNSNVENKSSNATLLRPDGERMLNGHSRLDIMSPSKN